MSSLSEEEMGGSEGRLSSSTEATLTMVEVPRSLVTVQRLRPKLNNQSTIRPGH